MSLILDRQFEGRLLDLGAGDGSFVEFCKRAGVDAAGIDICNGVNFEYDEVPYENDEFTIVFLYSVPGHINDPSNILNEIRRILAYDGILLVITPNLDSVKLSFFDDPIHVKPYNTKNIAWLMDVFGF